MWGERVLLDKELLKPPFVRSNPDTLLTTEDLLPHSPRFCAALERINSAISASWQEAADFASRFESERHIHDFVAKWNAHTYTQQLRMLEVPAVARTVRKEVKQVWVLGCCTVLISFCRFALR
jgi:hypothetical protein